jgi:hydroxymethylpyrimidine pyrophosphatase-like HAD family hydrolase
MKYEAIIFDLDGTAIPNTQDVLPSQRTADAIRLAEPIFKLCAATGRPITNGKKILDSLGLVDPCIISAGTQIINPQSGEVLWEYNIEPEDVQKVLEVCSPYPYELLVREELVGEGSPAAQHEIDGAVNVMYLMQCGDADSAVIMENLAKIPTVSASGVISWTGKDTDIHITHKEATKEHAIAKLLEIIGVSKDKTIGIGDANNDVHLFKGVGLKVAMGNATELLKSQADVVCDTVDNDGLAKYIEEQVAKQS